MKDWFPFCLLTEIHGQRVKRGQRVLVSDRIVAGVGPSWRAQPPPITHMTTRVNENTDDPTARGDLLYYYIVRSTDCGERHYEGWTSTSGVIAAAGRSRSGKMAGQHPSVERYLYNGILCTWSFVAFVVVPTQYTKQPLSL